MKHDKNVNSSAAISFPGALTIAFIVLKLCRVISWSWVWVLSPIWIPFAVALICVLIAAIFGSIEKS